MIARFAPTLQPDSSTPRSASRAAEYLGLAVQRCLEHHLASRVQMSAWSIALSVERYRCDHRTGTADRVGCGDGPASP